MPVLHRFVVPKQRPRRRALIAAKVLLDRRIATPNVAALKLPRKLQIVDGRPIPSLSVRGGIDEPCAPQWWLCQADAVLVAHPPDFPVARHRAMMSSRGLGTTA